MTIKEKIQKRLDIHKCTGRCTDYIMELVADTVLKAIPEKIQECPHGNNYDECIKCEDNDDGFKEYDEAFKAKLFEMLGIEEK